MGNISAAMTELTVHEARIRRGLTQAQLAAQSGVNQTTISDIETGRHLNPRLNTITQLAKALEIAPSRLRFTAPEPRRKVAAKRDRRGHTRKAVA